MALFSYLVFYFLAIQGSVVLGFMRNCDTSRCHDVGLRRDMERIGYVPTTEEQLQRLCPPTLTGVRCAVETIQGCVGRNLVELSRSDNKSAAAFAHGVVSISNLINDICTPGSEMRQNYLSSISCSKDLYLEPETTMKCRRQGEDFYRTYQESKALLGNQISVEDDQSEEGCMVMAYTFACFAVELRDECGETAHKTLIDVLKRFQPMKFSEECTDANLRKLKTEFLDALELDEPRRSIFSSVFESKKRRK